MRITGITVTLYDYSDTFDYSDTLLNPQFKSIFLARDHPDAPTGAAVLERTVAAFRG